MKHFNVAAAVFIQNNKVFCAQRKDAGETAKLWEFPGGKIEEGETPGQALEREIQEELCTKIRVEDFITTVNHEYKTFSITMHAYLCTILSGSLTLTEHLDSRWLSADELDTVNWAPADVPIVEKVRERMRSYTSKD
ncbi:MAG TPA: (deoxy)nucleoside triphosphate pyrophosphohydrolase [Treponemataceae bacterium]|nr:(deoxy)nucleoside triphosphate pyrophosphohydrolase [Treponemataceae bacterium]